MPHVHAIFPWRYRVSVLPQAQMRSASPILCGSVSLAVLWALFDCVFLVVPGKTGLDLGDVDVTVGEQHLSHNSLVPVALCPFNGHRMAGDLISEVLTGDFSEILTKFRRINAGESDLVSVMDGINQCDGVAIVYVDHST